MNILSIRTSTFGSAHPFVLIAAVAAVSLLSGCAGRTAHAMDSPGATKVRAKVQESAGGGRAAAKLPRVPPPEASAAKVAAGYVAPATGSTVGDERQAHAHSQHGRHLARDARWSIARKPASREFVRTGHRTASAAAVK